MISYPTCMLCDFRMDITQTRIVGTNVVCFNLTSCELRQKINTEAVVEKRRKQLLAAVERRG